MATPHAELQSRQEKTAVATVARPGGYFRKCHSAARRAGPRGHDTILALCVAGGEAGRQCYSRSSASARRPDGWARGRIGCSRPRGFNPAIQLLLSAAELAAGISNDRRDHPGRRALPFGAALPDRQMAACFAGSWPASDRHDVGPVAGQSPPFDSAALFAFAVRVARLSVRGAAKGSAGRRRAVAA